jgi:uncharacterized protein YndB with AHSA1/START domain
MSTFIRVETTVNREVNQVWQAFTQPEHIMNWNFASGDWHCPAAQSDFVVGGNFTYTMAAKDGSFSFDLPGTFDEIVEHTRIAYHLGDGRKVNVQFEEKDGKTSIVEEFEPESMNPHEMQQAGWQAILNNFKAYVESN